MIHSKIKDPNKDQGTWLILLSKVGGAQAVEK